MEALRQQAIDVESVYQRLQHEKLQRWTDEKPFLKDTIAGLSQAREMFQADIKQAEATMRSIASTGADPQATSSWFSWQQEKPSNAEALSDEALLLELDRLRKALSQIDTQIQAAKQVFTQPRREQERDIWEAQLIILQDSKRINQEEIDRLEFEKNTRARRQKLAKERAVAEASGLAQMAGLQEQLASVETRLNQLKQQLYFPDVKGYRFAFGGRGIYFGGKDVLVSEISGNFAVSAEALNADRQSALPTARITFQVGCGAPASAKRSNDSLNAVASRAASTTQSFKLRAMSGNQPSTDSAPPTSDPPADSALPTQPHRQSAEPPEHELPTRPGGSLQQSPHANTSTPDAQTQAGARSGGQHNGLPPRQPKPQPAALQDVRNQQAAGSPSRQGNSMQQQPQNSSHLSLHQSDVWSPLQASAPRQDIGDSQDATLNDWQQSSLHASSSGANAPGHPQTHPRALPPRAPDVHHDQRQSRSKRLANKFLKKMGTKERFRHPQSEGDPGVAPGSSSPVGQARPAYSPDVFDTSPKKGSKLAQRLLGKNTNGNANTSRLQFGSHVAGRSHQRWSDSLETPGFEPSATAEEVQRDVLEAASEAEAAPQTPRTPTTEDLESPSPLVPSSRQTSDYSPSQGPPLNGDSRPVGAPAHRSSSLTDSAYDGSLAGDPQQPDAFSNAEQQWSETGGAAGYAAAQQTATKGGKGKLRTTLSKMAHGATGGEGAENSTERGSEGGLDSLSQGGSNRKGLFVVVRLSEVGLIGEKGTKVPNASIAEISLELELALTFTFDYSRIQGWHTAIKPAFEVLSLERKTRGASVPLPKTIIRYILNAVLPRVLQRKLLGALPTELGQYLLEAGQGARLAGEIGVVGPPLSCLDADLAYQGGPSAQAKDARQAAQMNAAAQEARSLLGLTAGQAQMLAELFTGKTGLRADPSPCNLAELQAYYSRYSEEPQLWGSLCNIWDMALSSLARLRGSDADLDFRGLMQQRVSHQLLKPVRARFALTQASMSINTDAALTAVRDFFERSVRELQAKDEAMGRQLEGEPLEVQLQVLQAWYTFCAAKLRVFKGKFKHATCSVVGQADARSFAVGAERVSYEGPLRVRLPVKKKLDPSGDFSFEIPLPNPDRQVFVKRFAGGLKGALNSPLTAHSFGDTAAQPMARDRTDSAEEEAVPDWGQEKASKPPIKLGKVIVNGMRVRVRLDQQRLASMLQGLSPRALGSQFADVTSGMLGMLGDMASLSFAPYTPDDGEPAHYVLHMESSDVSNLNAEVLAVGFNSGEGVSPGRMLRLVHAITRAIMLTLGKTAKDVAELDGRFDSIHKLLTQEALAVSVLMAAESNVEQNSSSKPLMIYMSGTGDNLRESLPVVLTNDVELVSFIRFVKGESAADQAQRQR